jgi:hypothetical protein
MDHYQQHNCPDYILSSNNILHENDVSYECDKEQCLDNEDVFAKESHHSVRNVVPRIYV